MIAVKEDAADHNLLLSGWYRERHQQLQESLSTTIQNGRLCTQGNTWRFAFTKLVFRVMQLIPPLNRTLEKGPRAAGMIRYEWENGLPFLSDEYGGICLPQVYCSPASSPKGAGVSFTDDVIFQRDKKGMFQLLVLLDSIAELDESRKDLSDLDKLSGNYVIPHEATFLVQASEVKDSTADIGNNVFRLATAEEFATTESLCKSRPVPQFYDMYRIKKDLQGMSYAIVRPDRFLYAACDTAAQLQTICGGIQRNIVGR